MSNSDTGARPKSGRRGKSLAEVMARGREERRQTEELQRERQQEKEEKGVDGSDSDEEEYNMMIAGLSEVVCCL